MSQCPVHDKTRICQSLKFSKNAIKIELKARSFQVEGLQTNHKNLFVYSLNELSHKFTTLNKTLQVSSIRLQLN
jgi:hypothetical protein